MELYNTSLSHLDITGLSVPLNPLNPRQIDPWLSVSFFMSLFIVLHIVHGVYSFQYACVHYLQSVDKILEKTKHATKKLLSAAGRDQQNFEQLIRRAEEQNIVLRRQLETKRASTKGGTRLQINSEQKMKDDLEKLEDDLKKTIALVKTKEIEFDRAQKLHDEKELEVKFETDEYVYYLLQFNKAFFECNK